MRVINADGSVPEMCGNGVRCVALHVARARGPRSSGTLRVETDAAACACLVEDMRGEGIVTVDMGVVRLLGDRALDVDGQARRLSRWPTRATRTRSSSARFARGDVDHLGPRLATHPDFPRGTNVEFARVAGDGIDLVVWERGVGHHARVRHRRVRHRGGRMREGPRRARRARSTVRVPGGRLDITIDEDGRATMRGPARRVFSAPARVEPLLAGAAAHDD